MDNPLIGQLILQFALIACNAVFACAEIAVISMNDSKLAQLASKGDTRAIKLEKLTSQPAKFLATIQVAITLSGFLGSAFAAENFSDMLTAYMQAWNIPLSATALDAVAVILITLILSYFTLVFGELVPKRLAMKKAESLALAMASMISFIAKIAAPVVWVLTSSTNAILRLFGIDPNAEEEHVSEEEICMMVDLGNQKGTIQEAEKEMIQNIFAFNDLSVSQILTHRREVEFLWLEDSPKKWEETIFRTKHSLYPLCSQNVDNVLGILSTKDYFHYQDKSKEEILNLALKPAFYIPKGVRADILLKEMKKTKNTMAVVVDEYGGVLGIVTIQDLIEQLVGDLEDYEETETGVPSILQLEEGIWQIKGSADLSDVADTLRVELPTESFTTFSGFIIGTYGQIPEDGSHFQMHIQNMLIKVHEMKEHKVQLALVQFIQE